MKSPRIFNAFLSSLTAVLVSIALIGSAGAAALTQEEPPESGSPQIEIISP